MILSTSSYEVNITTKKGTSDRIVSDILNYKFSSRFRSDISVTFDGGTFVYSVVFN